MEIKEKKKEGEETQVDKIYEIFFSTVVKLIGTGK